ncbi:unnamed protein product [Arabidopsis arenosa]|uniref:Uncharacterized protein n=1 Tax=Arabidopsis arenosa TaxID=38785 RepID=A0A8S2A1U1_ARAAE|nr:unnamed protein product [Arabidopsis arenosa]
MSLKEGTCTSQMQQVQLEEEGLSTKRKAIDEAELSSKLAKRNEEKRWMGYDHAHTVDLVDLSGGLRGGRPWGFSSSAGPSNNPYGDNDVNSDDFMIPSEHVRRMLEGSESETFMALSPSVTSAESHPTREMEGSESSVETDPSEDLDEFDDDDVETGAESDEAVPLVAFGGNFGNVLITDFVVLSDDSNDDSLDEPEEQMATTRYLYGDSDIDVPMWESPDGVNASHDSDCVVFMPTEYGIPKQALAYNMMSPNVEFATPPSPPTPNFSETPRMSISLRRFASRTWYDGYERANNEMFHMSFDNEEVDEEVPDPMFECETIPETPPPVEESGMLFPPDESLFVPVTLGSSSMATMIENMIDAGTLGIEPIQPSKGMPVWNEGMKRSADGTVVTKMEREDGRSYSVTPFYFTCGQDGHYVTVCPKKRPENPSSSNPSPSTSAKKKKNLSIN